MYTSYPCMWIGYIRLNPWPQVKLKMTSPNNYVDKNLTYCYLYKGFVLKTKRGLGPVGLITVLSGSIQDIYCSGLKMMIGRMTVAHDWPRGFGGQRGSCKEGS